MLKWELLFEKTYHHPKSCKKLTTANDMNSLVPAVKFFSLLCMRETFVFKYKRKLESDKTFVVGQESVKTSEAYKHKHIF